MFHHSEVKKKRKGLSVKVPIFHRFDPSWASLGQSEVAEGLSGRLGVWYPCGYELVAWYGREHTRLVLRRSLSGAVGASQRKPPWARLTELIANRFRVLSLIDNQFISSYHFISHSKRGVTHTPIPHKRDMACLPSISLFTSSNQV